MKNLWRPNLMQYGCGKIDQLNSLPTYWLLVNSLEWLHSLKEEFVLQLLAFYQRDLHLASESFWTIYLSQYVGKLTAMDWLTFEYAVPSQRWMWPLLKCSGEQLDWVWSSIGLCTAQQHWTKLVCWSQCHRDAWFVSVTVMHSQWRHSWKRMNSLPISWRSITHSAMHFGNTSH